MSENDTVKLLRECSAGVKMGVDSLNELLPAIGSRQMAIMIENNKNAHLRLGEETESLLNEQGESTKAPNPIAKGMSWLKTNVRLAEDASDASIADLAIDGCYMGMRSLKKYLDQYPTASEPARELAQRLISLEDQLAAELRQFLPKST